MKRRREIAAAPVRSAAEAWKVACTLIADTLEKSPFVPPGSVADALGPLSGLGPALIAGGHLESDGLLLRDGDLHVTIVVLTADAALAVEENLNPVPGGASATDNWTLHVPGNGPLGAAIADAVKNKPHLSSERAAESERNRADKSGAGHSLIDVDALRRMRTSR